jgi:hypothetical protein
MQEAVIPILTIAILEIHLDIIQVPTQAPTIVLLIEALQHQPCLYQAVLEVVLVEVHQEADLLAVAAEAVVVNNK